MMFVGTTRIFFPIAVALPLIALATGPARAAAAEAWHSSLAVARREAGIGGKPILVRVGEESCPWCKKLELEIGKAAVQNELARWTCVYFDVQKSADEVRRFSVTATPALRILTPQGRLVASHDGSLEAEKLVQWLKKHHEVAIESPNDVLLGDEEPTLLDVMRLVRQFRDRDAVVREAAIRRLGPHPKIAASAVVRGLREGNLSVKLAAYELLVAWKAPVAGIDPWRPDSVTDQRLGALDAWSRKLDESALQVVVKELTDDQRAALRREIDQMLKADALEAVAVRERIARLGRAALPVVLERLKDAVSDQQRTRLLALRYRLVADGDLVLQWPGGLQRLADINPAVRHKAADELAAMGNASLQPLFLELFSDPDPLVRELSLRGLRNAGGQRAVLALVKLLHDPEPNVRAAVLKQLTEDAPKKTLDKIAEYVRWEKDPDLLVHAIRYFREVQSSGAVESLLPLLKHESWQVRAETAEALGKILSQSRFSSGEKKTEVIYDALLELLEDPDAFVVGRTLEGLSNVNAKRAVMPLVRAAGQHPDLAAGIVDLLARGSQMRREAIPHLRKFFENEDPAVRAAAIQGLTKTKSDLIGDEMIAAVRDSSSKVRTAAASATLDVLKHLHPEGNAVEINIEGGQRSMNLFSRFPAVEKLIELMSGPPKEASSSLSEPSEKDAGRGDQAEQPDESSSSKERSPAGMEKKKPGDAPEKPGDGTSARQKKKRANAVGLRLDAWLGELHAGRHRPSWTAELVKPFQEMLAAEQPEERLAAALVLVPLGKMDQALPVLLECAPKSPELFLRSGDVLRWLVWQRRAELFDKLDALAKNETQHVAVIQSMNCGMELRLAELYWKYLDRDKLSREVVDALERGLGRAYLGPGSDDSDKITRSMRQRVATDAGLRAKSGSTWKRLVAVDLLLQVAADDALTAAQAIAEDKTVELSLRKDAFQLVLAAQSSNDRLKNAVAVLGTKDEHRVRVALKFLARGADALRHLPETDFDIHVPGRTRATYFGASKPIIPEPPRFLRKEHVQSIALKLDPESAAYAGYLLALFEEPGGLDPLIRYWRTAEPSDSLDQLVYRAIAVLDDSSHMAVLKAIHGRVNKDYGIRPFYWTIRIMSGPEILRFRKQIRREVGMSKLQ